MIITCKREVPFRWILFAILPWASVTFQWGVMGVAFIFSLKKFVENPAGLTFIMSLPSLISIFTSPISSFISDRIWTRYGRRKPFILVSWIGTCSCLISLPLMPNLWSLVVVYIGYNIFSDIGTPVEPLKQEIVPPHQRGRATGAMQWVQNFANLAFYYIALGRFDDVRFIGRYLVDGEKAIYWSAATITFIMILLVSLGIKEINTKSALRGQPLSIKNFFVGILDSELWPVYMLVFGSAMLNSGLGSLGSLLYTDQFGYSKQEMGINVAIGGVINMAIIGFLTVFADRLNRMRSYQTLICLAILLNISYYSYITFIIPDRRPSLLEMVIFGEALSIVGILTSMVYVPMVYDYVTRNKMGTYVAGAAIVTRLTQVVTLNGVGIFIWGYATIFQPQAGEMVRVVFKREWHRPEMRALVERESWVLPRDDANVPASGIGTTPWFATGLEAESGQCWEIRLRNSSSEQLAREKAECEKKYSQISIQQKLLRDRLGEVKSESGFSGDLSNEIAALDQRIKRINEELAGRALNFQDQINKAFAGQILADGEQIQAVTRQPAILLEIPINGRPAGGALEKMLGNLRHLFPEIIDLHSVRKKDGYSLTVSSFVPKGDKERSYAERLKLAIVAISNQRNLHDPLLDTVEMTVTMKTAHTIDLLIVEDAITRKFSPITRVVNWMASFLGGASIADRQFSAIARNLRVAGETEHVAVHTKGSDGHRLAVTTILESDATVASSDDAVYQRLVHLLGDQKEAMKMRALYDRIVSSCAVQKITVARPFVAVGYAPLKYDYMSGYIWMFLMSLVGLGITIAFDRWEKRGLIRKLGLEESEAL